MTRDASEIGRGLAPARPPRPITPGERIHVIGVAGAGASAAALLGHEAGADVSGCDPGAPSPYTAALAERSIPVSGEHAVEHITRSDELPARVAVTKALTSVQPDHPELEAARQLGVLVEAWQQTVADAAVNQGGRLVAVAGTHGKSTSAGWLVHVLAEAGLDPAAFVGALLPSEITGGSPATARWGRGDVFVVEADEYAGNFDPYRPSLAVVLNVEWDHPDVFSDRAAVVDTFEAWLRTADNGTREVIVNVGDGGGAELAERLSDWGDRLVRVAPIPEAKRDVAVRYKLDGAHVLLDGLPAAAGPGPVGAQLGLVGEHNAANAACVATAAALLGLGGVEIATGLGSFAGVGRRFDLKGEPGGVIVIDDYGHHPTAIRATIAAVRSRYPGRRLWVAHEPLTYHRAAAMLEGLVEALAGADQVVVADIWAGRDPDTTITSAERLADAIAAETGQEVAAPGSPEATADYLAARVRPGDVVVAMGGGRSYVIAERLVDLLEVAAAE